MSVRVNAYDDVIGRTEVKVIQLYVRVDGQKYGTEIPVSKKKWDNISLLKRDRLIEYLAETKVLDPVDEGQKFPRHDIHKI